MKRRSQTKPRDVFSAKDCQTSLMFPEADSYQKHIVYC